MLVISVFGKFEKGYIFYFNYGWNSCWVKFFLGVLDVCRNR